MTFQKVILDGVEVKVAPRQNLEDLWCDTEVGPALDSGSGPTQEIGFEMDIIVTISVVIN